mmetsp:Transcript_53287/g.106906  ORF Transcript_53287/g.106906 Transcript_53287/m.106906 type:complete len:81 (+) Transcript_53287:193-435(+)
MCSLLERRGITVCRLLNQTMSGRDDRQLAFFPANFKVNAPPSAASQLPARNFLPNLPLSTAAFMEMTFPNQPYEEKKYGR